MPTFHIEGALKIFEIQNFWDLFVAFFQKAHFPKGFPQKPFPYEIIGLAKILVSENLFNAVVYGAEQ